MEAVPSGVLPQVTYRDTRRITKLPSVYSKLRQLIYMLNKMESQISHCWKRKLTNMGRKECVLWFGIRIRGISVESQFLFFNKIVVYS